MFLVLGYISPCCLRALNRTQGWVLHSCRWVFCFSSQVHLCVVYLHAWYHLLFSADPNMSGFQKLLFVVWVVSMWNFSLKISEEFKQVFYIDIFNHKSVEPSFKSLKTSCFKREFCSVFDNWKCLRSVQVVSEPPILLKWRESFDFGQKTAIKQWISWKTLKAPIMVLSKVWWVHYLITVSWPRSNTSTSNHQARGFQHHFERSLNIINCRKWSETPFQNMSFWETLRITNLEELHNIVTLTS